MTSKLSMLAVVALYSIGCIYNYVLAKCPITDRKSNFNEQLRLRSTLFKNYHPDMPAVAVQPDNLTVKIPRLEVLLTLIHLKLTQVVEKQHKAEFLLDYLMDWRDERLEWNPEDYCGLDHIYVPSSSVWIPDIIVTDVNRDERLDSRDFVALILKFFSDGIATMKLLHVWPGLKTNRARHSFENYRRDEDDYVRVSSSGHLHFLTLTRTATVCPMDIQDFPFDQQDCTVNLTFYPFSDDELFIKLALEPFSLDDFTKMGNEEWQVTYVAAMTNDSVEEDWEFYQVFILMKRSPSLYITMIITPPFVVNVLSIFGIFMNTVESMGKLGMAVTNVMSLTFVLGILATDLPKTHKLPKIVIFVLGNLLVMVFALITTEILPYIKQLLSRYWKSDRRKLDELYRKFECVLCLVFEIANLINFIVLIA